MKYKLEDKIRIVRLVLDGTPIPRVCSINGVSKSSVLLWVEQYRSKGELGLQRKRKKCLSYSKKVAIACEYIEKGLPLQSLSLKYHVSAATISIWVKQYQEGKLLRKRIKKSGKSKPMSRPKKKAPVTELEQLREENLELRAEVAYLKKLRALVEERELRAHQNAPKPSTH